MLRRRRWQRRRKHRDAAVFGREEKIKTEKSAEDKDMVGQVTTDPLLNDAAANSAGESRKLLTVS